MITVLVLEDCKESRVALETIISNYRDDLRVLSASSYEQAMLRLEQAEDIRLFFLDINLDEHDKGDQSGLQFAKQVRKISQYAFTPIVFLTSMADLELVSYRETQCYNYLKKPYDETGVISVLKKVLEQAEEKKKQLITIKKDGINYRMETNDILWIEAVPRGIKLGLKGEELEVRYLSIKQILARLPATQFIQCHRMYVVNRNAIDYIDLVNQMIRIKKVTKTIEIGVTYKSAIRRWMNEAD